MTVKNKESEGFQYFVCHILGLGYTASLYFKKKNLCNDCHSVYLMKPSKTQTLDLRHVYLENHPFPPRLCLDTGEELLIQETGVKVALDHNCLPVPRH